MHSAERANKLENAPYWYFYVYFPDFKEKIPFVKAAPIDEQETKKKKKQQDSESKKSKQKLPEEMHDMKLTKEKTDKI